MERGEWENDPEYPSAPLPAHERTWRHPSEQGASQWIQSEPPIVVGRGLSVATGTVGMVLAMGLLWLMIPHDGPGEGVAVQGSTTVRSLGGETFVSHQAPVAISGTPITSFETTVTTVRDATGTAPGVATTAPASTQAPSTLATAAPTTRVEQITTTVAASGPAMAVAMAPGHFVAVTAAAVGTASSVTVRLTTGDTVVGSVYSVDMETGIAVVSLPDDVAVSPIEPSQVAMPTSAATVLAPDPTTVSVWRNADGTQVAADPSVHLTEGSLVLDADDRLIGMCTMAGGGLHVLDASALLDAINAAIASEAPVWMGLRVGADDAGNLVVTDVTADGPAALAGVQIGTLIRGIDGVSVSNLDALRNGLLVHRPGDTTTLSVVASGSSSPTDIAITLMPDPGSL